MKVGEFLSWLILLPAALFVLYVVAILLWAAITHIAGLVILYIIACILAILYLDSRSDNI
jgi:hypothetical protein